MSLTQKTVIHTIREAPLEAALRTYERNKTVDGVNDAMIERLAHDVRRVEIRVRKLEEDYREFRSALNGN